MKKIFSFVLLSLAVTSAQAKSFKVGPTSSSEKMGFTTINLAMSSK